MCGSRRVVLAGCDVSGNLVVDPAVDLDASDLDAYSESMFDPKYLVLKEGTEATYWTITALTMGQRDEATRTGTLAGVQAYYIRCGLLDHATWTIEDVDDGSVTNGPQPDRKKHGSDSLASQKWIEDMRFPQDIRTALWSMINTLCEAKRPLSKPSEPPAGAEPSSKNDEPTAASSA